MKNFIAALTAIFLVPVLGTAQVYQRCGSAAYLKELELRDTAFQQQRVRSESAYSAWMAANTGGASRSVVTIPVVFHMLYHDTSQYLDDAIIQSQLDVINEDYRRNNPDTGQTPLAFRAIAADAEIEFCLAKRTPSGQATTGIVHKYTADTAFSNFDKPKQTISGGDDAWDAAHYLNIWVAAFANPNFLGLGTFPGGDPLYDGVVINYKAFGRIGSHLLPQYNKGRSLTHEIGHWLNLLHVWGDDGSTCNADDNISDTPLQSEENYGCPSYPKTDNCTSSFPGIMFMNYLDYTDDECMNLFTEGQKARMLAALNVDRATILSSNGCVPVDIEEHDLGSFFSIYPNPVLDRLFISSRLEKNIKTELVITSLLGEIVFSSHIIPGSGIDVSKFGRGIYFVNLSTSRGSAAFKLIKD